MSILGMITGGLGAVTGVANAVKGVGKALGIGKSDNQKQYEQQEKLQGLQIKGAKEMADYSQQKQQENWDNTNAEAQMEHYRKAGLNPALMYDMAGAGATMGSGSSAMPTGATAADPNGAKAMDIASQMQMAQMALMAAQTKKTNVEADNLATQKPNIEADTTLKGAQTQSLLAGIENQKVQNRLITAEADLKEVAARVANATEQDAIQQIGAAADKAAQEVFSATSQAGVDLNTVQAKIAIIRAQAANEILKGIAIKQGVQLDQTRIQEITNGIQQKWRDLELKGQGQGYEHSDRLKAIEEYTSNALKVAGIAAAGRLVSDIVGVATKKMPTGSSTRVERWDGEGNHTGGSQTTTTNGWK